MTTHFVWQVGPKKYHISKVDGLYPMEPRGRIVLAVPITGGWDWMDTEAIRFYDRFKVTKFDLDPRRQHTDGTIERVILIRFFNQEDVNRIEMARLCTWVDDGHD